MKISSVTGARQAFLAKNLLVASALMAAIAVSGPAFADTFTLTNSNGLYGPYDGQVTFFPGGFDLIGSDNPVGGANYTDYVATALTNETITINWTYTTNDCCGSYWDPAGYEINGARTQLSTDTPTGNPTDKSTAYAGKTDSFGSYTFTLLANDTYGMYVYTRDGADGAADIRVTGIGPTPLPAALPLFMSGLAGLGLLGWRRKRKAQAALA